MPESTVGQFNPLHAAHAIESVQFSINFSKPISDESWTAVLSAAREFKDELPGEEAIQTFTPGLNLTIGAQPGGIVRKRVSADGTPEEEFVVTKTFLMYRTSRYTRWSACWAQAKKLMDRTLASISGGIELSAISLNVVDKFIWTGDAFGGETLARLIQRNSDYVSPHVFKRENFWHSHTGAFVKQDAYTRRLENVNLDHIEEDRAGDRRRTIAITVVLSDQFQQVGYEPFTDRVNGTSGVIDGHIQQLHVQNKQILANIISNDFATRIALNSATTT